MSPVSEVEGYCLRWNNHHGTLVDVLQSLYQEQSFVDVTLAAEGQHIQVHRLVLCACSDYFQELLTNDWDKQAIIFLKDVPFTQLKALVNYMYKGEVSIAEDQLDGLLSTAESLKIKGLTDNDRRMNNNGTEQTTSTTTTTTNDELAESLRINQIGPGMTEDEVSLVGQTMQNSMSAMPLFAAATNQLAQLHHHHHHHHQQAMFASPLTGHGQSNGEFAVEPKLEADNEGSAAASENDEWSESDLTAPATPHETPVPQSTAGQHLAPPPPQQQQQQHHPPPPCTPVAQTFTTTTTPFPHVPWSESLAAAAAAAIASTSTIPGPGPSAVLNAASYSIPPQPPIQPPVTPTRGKQRNSRRPSRTPNSNASHPVPEKPYGCNRCGRSYSRRGALIQHQRYECGVEPQFSCPMCPYKIKRKDSLNRHIRNMHHNQTTN